MAREQADGGKRTVYTDGPLIHNNQMMTALGKEGVREVGDYQSSSAIELADEEREDSVVVVRAHGISPERRKYLKNLDMPFKDATCPDVGIIAGKVRMHAEKGYDVVIFGDPKHPEVIGLMGYAGDKGHAVQTREDVDALSFEFSKPLQMRHENLHSASCARGSSYHRAEGGAAWSGRSFWIGLWIPIIDGLDQLLTIEIHMDDLKTLT